MAEDLRAELDSLRALNAVLEARLHPQTAQHQAQSPKSGHSKVYTVDSGSNEDISIKGLLVQLNKYFMEFIAQHPRGRSRNQATSRTNSRSNTPVAKRCWYHKKYGNKATKCTNPCEWKPENSTSSQ